MKFLCSRRLAVFNVVALFGVAAPDSSYAGFVYDSANGLYYGLTSTATNWASAEADAVSMGGHLAAVTNVGVENFLISNFLQVPQSSAVPYWIGLTDDVNGVIGSYSTWTTGQPVTYTDWASGEPNDVGGVEHYITINWPFAGGYTSTTGAWNDTPLDGTTGYPGNTNGPYFGIIQLDYNPAAVPEPSGLVMALIGSGMAVVAAAATRRCRREASTQVLEGFSRAPRRICTSV